MKFLATLLAFTFAFAFASPGYARVPPTTASSSPGQQAQTTPRFTNPTAITNPYLPLASLKRDILEGETEGQSLHVERTLKPGTKSFTIEGQTVQALIMEDRAILDGELQELTLDYFAQSDDGTVYYLGEDVDMYENGQVVSHEGAWLYGVHTNQAGIIMPARPQPGDKFQSENVPGITREDNEVVSLSETVNVPAGTYRNCLKIREVLSDGAVEYKYYAPGVGIIKEEFEDGQVSLVSQNSTSAGAGSPGMPRSGGASAEPVLLLLILATGLALTLAGLVLRPRSGSSSIAR